MYAMMQCKAKSENVTHILGYRIWAVTIALLTSTGIKGHLLQFTTLQKPPANRVLASPRGTKRPHQGAPGT